MADLITSFSDAELHDLENEAEAAMAAALDAVMEIIASRIERNARPITSAAADEPAKEPGQPYVSPDDLASIGPLWDEQVQQRLMPMVAQVYQDSAGQIHASLVDAADLPDLPAASSLAAETYLAGVQNVYRNVGTDLWSTARTELQEGFKQGESIDELAARVRGAGKISARNAELVARSTVIEASNAGSIATARASGLDMMKEWINTHDARTRPTHQDEALGGVGGQRVDLNAQFTVGGFSADAPGDVTLPPQEKYRCRCTVGYVMGKRDVTQAHTEAHQQAEQQALPNTAPAQPAAATVTAPELRATTRAAARARHREISAAEPYARLGSDVDHSLPADGRWSDVTTTVMHQAIDTAQQAGAAPELLQELRAAVMAKDIARVRAAANELTAGRGLTPIGARFETVAYDPETMESLIEDAGIEPGQPVQVWRQGHQVTLANGDVVRLDRAVVKPITAAPTMTAKAAKYQTSLDGIEDMASSIEAGPVKVVRTFTDGAGDVDLVQATDGRLWVRKPTVQVDEEQAGALVGRAVGLVDTPRVYRPGTGQKWTIYQDFVADHPTAYELLRGPNQEQWPALYQAALRSDDGQRMGLLDTLIMNGDRNPGNWFVDQSTGHLHLIPIDHGFAFAALPHNGTRPMIYGAFGENLVKQTPRSYEWIDNLFTQEDIDLVAERMLSLADQFDLIQHADWYQHIQETLIEVRRHAKGTRNLIAAVR